VRPQAPATALQFLHAHATHPLPEMAVEIVWAQLSAQGVESLQPTLGWCYLTDELAQGTQEVLDALRARMPTVSWVGAVGTGILGTGIEYLDEPALAVMVCNLPPADFRIFHGRHPLPARQLTSETPSNPGLTWPAHTAQVHADARSPDLAELITELARRTDTGYLFGGLSAGQHGCPHLAWSAEDTGSDQHEHSGVWRGGLSGVAFSSKVRLVSRVSQGCSPVGPRRLVTRAERNVVHELDGLPALSCLMQDLGVTATVSAQGWQREALSKVRSTLAGLTDAGSSLMDHGQHFGADTRVRHIVGLDPARQAVALADNVEAGMQLAFCQRHQHEARQDLVRICAEIREEFDPQEHPGSEAVGAIYISCAGRSGANLGGLNAEMELLSHALGNLPVVGFFAGGEIAKHHLHSYTGVLTVFGR
jgi:small ligand-binding sensory domain FIST